MAANPARMPTCFLAKLRRTTEEQAIWEQLPEGLRRDIMVWIDPLYFRCDDSMKPCTVVWFVNQRTDDDLCMCLPLNGRLDLEPAMIAVRL